jgi:hypothetical protein
MSSIICTQANNQDDECITSPYTGNYEYITDKQLQQEAFQVVITSFNALRKALEPIACYKQREHKFQKIIKRINYPTHIAPHVFDLLTLCDIKYGHLTTYQDFDPEDQLRVLEIWGDLKAI